MSIVSAAAGGTSLFVMHETLVQVNGETQMKLFDVIAAIFVVVGALNWGLIGLFQFNLVAAILGDATPITRFIYVLVGMAGLFQAVQWKAIQHRWAGHKTPLPA
jgi:uncharacterized membrane protein YuzA (DUF378 family)